MNGDTLIRVEKLQKHYNGGVIKALDGINTEIKKGEVVVVIGPSGSGKSTFLRCLNLLEVPTGGNIFFEGGQGKCVSFPAFRRAEAEDCHCARPLHGAGGHAF